MKRKYYILGVLATLCLLGTGYYAWTLYDAYRKQVVEWNEGAKAAFEEALWLEVNKRAEVPIYSYSSGEHGITTLKERIPDSVSVMTIEGRRKYKIDRDRYENSLIKETRRRVRLSTLFSEESLSVDTLTSHWDSLLFEKQIPAKSKIRFIYTDLNLKNDTIYSSTDNSLRFDSLTIRYLGFRCEYELLGYVSYSYWLLGVSFMNLFWILFPWVIFILLVIFYTPTEKLFRRKFVKEKIVEKEIHVADVTMDKAKIYHLPDESLFDSFAGTITKGDLIHTLLPQSSLLLKLFLRKENHCLTTTEIEQGLWNGNGSTDKIHKAIQRLRIDLKKISPDLVIKNVNGNYELK